MKFTAISVTGPRELRVACSLLYVPSARQLWTRELIAVRMVYGTTLVRYVFPHGDLCAMRASLQDAQVLLGRCLAPVDKEVAG